MSGCEDIHCIASVAAGGAQAQQVEFVILDDANTLTWAALFLCAYINFHDTGSPTVRMRMSISYRKVGGQAARQFWSAEQKTGATVVLGVGGRSDPDRSRLRDGE